MSEINKKYKTPAEAKRDAKKLIEDIASMDNENMGIEDIFSRAKATINSMLNSENVKLNTLLIIALKQKMTILERVYKLLDRCLTELLSDRRLNTFNIESSELLDKTTKLMVAFSNILDSLTNSNEVINFSVTNNITQNNIKGEIQLPEETRDKLRMLTMQYIQMKKDKEETIK